MKVNLVHFTCLCHSKYKTKKFIQEEQLYVVSVEWCCVRRTLWNLVTHLIKLVEVSSKHINTWKARLLNEINHCSFKNKVGFCYPRFKLCGKDHVVFE